MAGPKPSESAPAVQVDGSFVLEASTTTLHLRLTLLSLTVLPYLLYFFLFIPIHSPRPQKRTASFRLATLRELSPYGYNPSNLSESGNELSAHFTIKGARHSGGSSRATPVGARLVCQRHRSFNKTATSATYKPGRLLRRNLARA